METSQSSRILKARKRLGKKIEGLIREQGYPSLENFGLSNGFHKATIHQVVRASADPRFSTLLRIADALEMRLEDLIQG